jgi:hypothetical protein
MLRRSRRKIKNKNKKLRVQEMKNRKKRRGKREQEIYDKNTDNNITKCHIYPKT